MEQVVQTVFEYLTKLGGIGLFFGIFIDALGLPFPGGFMIIMSGYLISRGDLGLFEAVLAVMAGYLPGTSAAYYVGRNIGEPFIEKYGRFLRITPERLDKAQKQLKHSAAFFIIFGRFIPTVGNITPYIAGLSRLKFGCFFIYSVIFAALWCAFNITLGCIFGRSWRKAAETVGSKSWIAALAVILLYLGYKYYKSKKVKLKGGG